jgi:hypothetical protein
VFFFMVMLSPSKLTLPAKTTTWCVLFNFSSTRLSYTFLMVHSKSKLKSNGNKASPCSSSFRIWIVSDKCVPIPILLEVSFKYILINLSSYIGSLHSIRILYNTSLLNES